jgi:anaphase-promoting complex subunit 6
MPPDDPNDAFWLAQTQFLMNQYSRAERLLTRPFSTTPLHYSSTNQPQPPITNGHPPVSAYPAFAHLSAKGKGREMDLPTFAPDSGRLPMGPGGLVDIPAEQQDSVSRLVDMSVACRYLAAQCQVLAQPL